MAGKLRKAYTYFLSDQRGEPNIEVWFKSFNETAQSCKEWFDKTPLAVWSSPQITGDLLDLTAVGIYGFYRNAVQLGVESGKGPYNTAQFNELLYNGMGGVSYPNVPVTLTDDYYKRGLTWNMYRADGFEFSIPWLKRRIARFLQWKNGNPQGNDALLLDTRFISLKDNGLSTPNLLQLEASLLPNSGLSLDDYRLLAVYFAGGALAVPPFVKLTFKTL